MQLCCDDFLRCDSESEENSAYSGTNKRSVDHRGHLVDFNFRVRRLSFSEETLHRLAVGCSAASLVHAEKGSAWPDNHLVGHSCWRRLKLEVKSVTGIETPLNDALDLLASKVTGIRRVRHAVGIWFGVIKKTSLPIEVGTIAVWRERAVYGNVGRSCILLAVLGCSGRCRAFIVLVLGGLNPELLGLRVLCHFANGDVLRYVLLVDPRVIARCEIDSELNLIRRTNGCSQHVRKAKVLKAFVEIVDSFCGHFPLD